MAERLVIRIEDAVIERREVKGRNGTFTAETQYGIADMPNGERRRVRIRVQRERGAYPPGSYVISDLSFGVGQYGDFEIGQLTLVPSPVARSASPQASASGARI
jgi:Helix-destabilising protein